jgi:hypothetical protein
MKKRLNGLLALCLTLCLTACFDITEEVTVAKNGSGSYTQTINAEKMQEQLAFFAAMDTTGQMVPKLKQGIDSSLRDNWEKFKNIKGISNLKIENAKDFVYTVKFDFTDILALNSALNTDKKEAKDKDAYSWKKGKLTRKDLGLNLADLGMEDANQQMDMVKGMMGEANYTLIFRLPKAVKSVSNEDAKIGDDKMTVTHKVSMLDIIEKKANLGLDIEYKK